eukprot:TRINITY_DN13109_c0_g1_i1.p1 TRINITY_DN13109_c0_g1~~TRINITY_DN13109_c0_g1_i1.p1  ORF type:complete len:103 (-),score=12.50 TRINITY_DN13109_c0_g1_i1:41-349(-)
MQPWSIIATGIVVVACYIPLHFEKVLNPPKSFRCPLVPFVPCLGIMLNTTFIVSLEYESIVRLLIWTVIGVAIYFGYGIWNSKLYKDEEQKKLKEEGLLNTS